MAQLEQLVKYMEELPRGDNGSQTAEIESIAFEMYSKIRLANVNVLSEIDKESNERKNLSDLCSRLIEQINTLAIKLSGVYFSHSGYSQQHTEDDHQFEV